VGLHAMKQRWILWLIVGGPVVVLIAGWLLTR
jgi:hypothetical protein